MKEHKNCESLYLILTTEADYEKAFELANSLLKKKLVACVSLNKIKSLFLWEGKINESEEVKLFIKTKHSKLNATLENIRGLHSYKIPEIIYFEISCNKEYAKWIKDVTS